MKTTKKVLGLVVLIVVLLSLIPAPATCADANKCSCYRTTTRRYLGWWCSCTTSTPDGTQARATSGFYKPTWWVKRFDPWGWFRSLGK